MSCAIWTNTVRSIGATFRFGAPVDGVNIDMLQGATTLLAIGSNDVNAHCSGLSVLDSCIRNFVR